MTTQVESTVDKNGERLQLHPNRFFMSGTADVQDVAVRLFDSIRQMPIISTHGHADPRWFAENRPLGDPASVLLQVDHYVFRMLYSQGVPLKDLGILGTGESPTVSQRDAWRTFAKHYSLFRGTPTRIWLDYVFSKVFNIDVVLSEMTADHYYDVLDTALQTDDFLPNSILRRYSIEYLATTEGALDSLEFHQVGEHPGSEVIPTFRPDDVIDADRLDFTENVTELGEITGEDTDTWLGFLAAIQNRRAFFRSKGATATDHGHPTALTVDLDADSCQMLLTRCLSDKATAGERELFRAQMLTEMAGMSVEDGMVMQLHPGSVRNHNGPLFARYGADKGADIPAAIDYVQSLKPLLQRFGSNTELTLILFTLDEGTYSRELAPLAGHYPAIRLGAPWWFNDSPEGMLRFLRNTTETAGFSNQVGFCDDTRGLLSIPARHDLARRIDCRFLAEWVVDHRLSENDAHDIARERTYEMPTRAYKLPIPAGEARK